ncbi:MAG: PASTA domain-containing protein [Fimbriimonadaceae bacterium]
MIGSTVGTRYRIVQEMEDHPVWGCYSAQGPEAEPVRIRVLLDPYDAEPGFVRALERHAELLRGMRLEGFEEVKGFFQDEGTVALATDRADAITLDERLRKLGSLSTQLALTLAADAAEALARLHAEGLAHGDVSPYNILLPPKGAALLALPGYWETYSESRSAGIAMLQRMSPYLAPEISTGAMPSPGSDIYSLGVVLYQMVTGRVPYSSSTASGMAEKHSMSPYPTIKFSVPGVPTAVDEIARKCLAKSPRDRYASASALAEDLRYVLDALRFGHNLTWPPPRREPEVAPIAPSLNAVEGQPQTRKERIAKVSRAHKQTDGVPTWLTVLFYLTTSLVILAVGGWVAFNSRAPKLVDVPNVVGLPSNEAKTRLSKASVKMVVLRWAVSDRYPSGVVIDQQPPPGQDKAREGSFVNVVLSSGGKVVVVPDLAGKSQDQAKDILSEVGLLLDTDVIKVRDKNAPFGQIVSQEPAAKKKVDRDSIVRVTISNGDTEPVEPGSGGKFTYTMKVKMPEGTVPIMVRVDITDDNETVTVHEDEHSPGESFEVEADSASREVTFRIYFDDELVRKVTKEAG